MSTTVSTEQSPIQTLICDSSGALVAVKATTKTTTAAITYSIVYTSLEPR